jgi:hypothetical protein
MILALLRRIFTKPPTIADEQRRRRLLTLERVQLEQRYAEWRTPR